MAGAEVTLKMTVLLQRGSALIRGSTMHRVRSKIQLTKITTRVRSLKGNSSDFPRRTSAPNLFLRCLKRISPVVGASICHFAEYSKRKEKVCITDSPFVIPPARALAHLLPRRKTPYAAAVLPTGTCQIPTKGIRTWARAIILLFAWRGKGGPIGFAQIWKGRRDKHVCWTGCTGWPKIFYEAGFLLQPKWSLM